MLSSIARRAVCASPCTAVVMSRGAASSSRGSVAALDPNLFITQVNSRRQASPIRSLQPLMALPGMISLGGGMPSLSLFPFKGLTMDLADGTQLKLSPDELNVALQYSPTPGIPSFVKQLKALMVREHKPAMAESAWTVSVATGSTDALFKTFDMLVEAEDNVLIEAPTYSGSLAALRPLGCNFLEIEVDGLGMIPSKLESMLATCSQVAGRAKPRILYIIPTGQNPAGCTLTLERKKEIYAIACKHNLIILEDDPYFFLSYGAAAAPAVGAEKSFSRPLSPSFFSLDTEGRVIRFDSFSKILSSGLRLGTVTGPKAFIERIDLMSQASNLHTSGVSQMMVSKLLSHWGDAGWAAHINQVCLYYARRRDVFLALAEKHLKGLATWTRPTAGMFVYFSLNGVTDSKKLVEGKALDAKVIMVPGQAFSPKDLPSNCVRAAFSTATDADMNTALERFAKLLKSEAAAAAAPKSKL